MFWLILAYLLLTAGEVLVYGTMLDLSYAYAPKSMKGFVTACFLVTNALGNMINTQYIPFYEKPHTVFEGTSFAHTFAGHCAADYFALDAGIALAAAVVFFFVGRQFNRANQGGTPGAYGARPCGSGYGRLDRSAAAAVVPPPAGASRGYLCRTHPDRLLVHLLVELAQRLAFYGIRTLLFVYLTAVLGFADAYATQVSYTFKAGCYLSPLLGGLSSPIDSSASTGSSSVSLSPTSPACC